jgi:hypothetical protein
LKKYIGLLAKGMGLGLVLDLCLAGAVGLIYRAIHSAEPLPHYGRVNLYFFMVGGLMGLVGGWCLSLQMILAGLLSTLFLKISELVPLTAAAVTEEWANKMEIFFREVLRPLPSFFSKIVETFLVVRFRDYARVNRAIDKAKQKEPLPTYSPEWMSQVALHFFLEPLWVVFYGAYVILFVITCVFWGLAFL